jgi:hypothetical protein
MTSAISFNNKVLGKTGVTGFIPAAHAVADEMGKLFKGANLSDHEIKRGPMLSTRTCRLTR